MKDREQLRRDLHQEANHDGLTGPAEPVRHHAGPRRRGRDVRSRRAGGGAVRRHRRLQGDQRPPRPLGRGRGAQGHRRPRSPGRSCVRPRGPPRRGRARGHRPPGRRPARRPEPRPTDPEGGEPPAPVGRRHHAVALHRRDGRIGSRPDPGAPSPRRRPGRLRGQGGRRQRHRDLHRRASATRPTTARAWSARSPGPSPRTSSTSRCRPWSVPTTRRSSVSRPSCVGPRHDGTVHAPSDFVTIAERSNLVVDLDRWVIGETVGVLARWKDDPRTASLTASVNLSARHASVSVLRRPHPRGALGATASSPAVWSSSSPRAR